MTHGSLFSGIGGFELGAELAGIKTVWSCKIESSCRQVLKKHFPNTHQYTDITKLKNPPYVDVISGGFPCQDISVANPCGKGLKGERSGLWKEMYRVVSEVRPRFVLIENNPNLLRKGLQQILYDLTQIGYDAEWQCLQACNFNLPHKRERLFIIAYTMCLRRQGRNLFQSQLLQKVLQKQTLCKVDLPSSFKRFDRNSDYRTVKLHDGFSKELDRKAIEMFGNAVIPIITYFLFECIKNYEKGEI